MLDTTAVALVGIGVTAAVGAVSGYAQLRLRVDRYADDRLRADIDEARTQRENRRFLAELSAPRGPAGAHPVPMVDLGPLGRPPSPPATFDEAMEQYVTRLGAQHPDPTLPLRVWIGAEWDRTWLTRHVLEHQRRQGEAARRFEEKRRAAPIPWGTRDQWQAAADTARRRSGGDEPA